MSELDAALAERNEAAMTEARRYLGHLSKAWEALEEEFRKLGVLKTAYVHFATIYEPGDHAGQGPPIGDEFLGIAKIKGQWRICLGSCSYGCEYEITWKPIVDCPLADRTKGFKFVKELRKAIVESNETAVEELEKAARDAAELLKSMGLDNSTGWDPEIPF